MSIGSVDFLLRVRLTALACSLRTFPLTSRHMWCMNTCISPFDSVHSTERDIGCKQGHWVPSHRVLEMCIGGRVGKFSPL